LGVNPSQDRRFASDAESPATVPPRAGDPPIAQCAAQELFAYSGVQLFLVELSDLGIDEQGEAGLPVLVFFLDELIVPRGAAELAGAREIPFSIAIRAILTALLAVTSRQQRSPPAFSSRSSRGRAETPGVPAAPV
jgi:hypothetical protein